MDAFDSDVLIFAARADDPLGRRVNRLMTSNQEQFGDAGIGSLLLVPEVRIKPVRTRNAAEDDLLVALLAQLVLFEVTSRIVDLAVRYGAEHGLKAVDAIHLATAVDVGADRFITNNSRDFPKTIDRIEITYPGDLPDVA